jgi:hypothetical protein
MSFDITIGYDKAKLRPTDVLKENTLSATMAYAPFLNTVVPNEMRIAAGNIIKPVYGDLPLVAVVGDFLGTCTDFDTLSYPWPATFNSELKKWFTVIRRDTVKAIASPKKYIGLGYELLQDTVTCASDSSAYVTTVLRGDLAIDSVFVLQVAYDERLASVQLHDSSSVNVINKSKTINNVAWTLQHKGGKRNVELIWKWQGLTDDSVMKAKVSTASSTTCTCIAPAMTDTLTLKKFVPIVSVSSSDERIESVYVFNDNIHIQCNHEQMKQVVVFNLSGEHVLDTQLPAGSSYLQLSTLPAGSYVMHVTCGNNNHVKLIVK